MSRRKQTNPFRVDCRYSRFFLHFVEVFNENRTRYMLFACHDIQYFSLSLGCPGAMECIHTHTFRVTLPLRCSFLVSVFRKETNVKRD